MRAKDIFGLYSRLFLLPAGMVAASCSSEKYLPDGAYQLNRVAVVSDAPGVDVADMKAYVRQKEKPKLFSLVKNPFSRKPVVYDTLQASLSCRDLLTAMQNRGYLQAGVDLYTSVDGRKIDTRYVLHPGVPFHIGKVDYIVEDDSIQNLLHLDRPENQQLKPGMQFSVDALNAERKRISTILVNNGYSHFNKDFIQFGADTIQGQKDIALTLRLLKYKPSNNAPATLHPRYWVRKVSFLSPDSTRLPLRRQVMLNATDIREGQPYNAEALQRTYNNFARLQAIKYTNIQFEELPDTNLLDCNIQVSANKRHTLSFQPEGTNTTGNLGAAASLTYTNRNLFRGSEQLSVELRGAYEAIKGLEGYNNENYTEYSLETKLTFPRMVAPFLSKSFRRRQNATSELAVSWDMQNRPEFYRRVFSTAWRYRWNEPHHHLNWRIDLLDLNYVYMPWISSTFKADYLDDTGSRNVILRYNYEDLFIMKVGFGVSYNDGVDAVRANIETAGNVLEGLSALSGQKANADGQYTFLNIAFAQYAKFDVDYVHLAKFDDRNSLALHAGFGIAYPYGNSTVLPFEKRYFSGGANSVRGWGVRELGPGKFRGTDGRIDFINQTGDVKLDLNAEYRAALFWKFQGALFVDAGNIWTLRNYADQPGGQFTFSEFYKQIAVAYGLGLRLDFSYFVLRFDMGMKAINPAYETSQEHWAVIHPKLSRDFSFHFAVGLPF